MLLWVGGGLIAYHFGNTLLVLLVSLDKPTESQVAAREILEFGQAHLDAFIRVCGFLLRGSDSFYDCHVINLFSHLMSLDYNRFRSALHSIDHL